MDSCNKVIETANKDFQLLYSKMQLKHAFYHIGKKHIIKIINNNIDYDRTDKKNKKNRIY